MNADRMGEDLADNQPSTMEHDAPALDQTFAADNLFALRSAVAAHGADLGLTGQRLGDLVLLAHELASNAVRHAGATMNEPGRLRLWRRVERDGRVAVVCEISDTGPGLPEPAQAGQHPVEVTAPNGRGLWIARQVADELDIASSPHGTTITATLIVA